MKQPKPKKKTQIVLSEAGLSFLRRVTKSGTRKAREITRARILLLSHAGNTNRQIVSALGCSLRSITAVRRRYMERGEDAAAAITDAHRPGQPRKILPAHEAFVVATACTDAPQAHAHWTLEALKDKLLDTYRDLKTVSDERIRQILLTHELKPWREKNVVRPSAH